MCPCVKIVEDQTYLPDYSFGTRGTTESLQNVFTLAHTRLVCEPEFLWEALFSPCAILFWSPYVGWVNRIGLNTVEWNPSSGSVDGDMSSAHFITLPWNTEFSWRELSDWIGSNSTLLQEMRTRMHEWLSVHASTSIQTYMDQLFASGALHHTKHHSVGRVRLGHTPIDVTIPTESEDAIGSLVGTGGIVSKRNRLLTGLRMDINDDSIRIHGEVDLAFQPKDIRTLFVQYLSYRTKTFSVQTLLQVDDETFNESYTPQRVNREIQRLDVRKGLIPIQIGNGVHRTYRHSSKTLYVRG